MNLDNSLVESVPFLTTYEGTDYYDNATSHYIVEKKIQRGSWKINGVLTTIFAIYLYNIWFNASNDFFLSR